MDSIKQRLDAFTVNTQSIRPFYGDRWIELQGSTSTAIYAQLTSLLHERGMTKDNYAVLEKAAPA